jgi:hypothetical protein
MKDQLAIGKVIRMQCMRRGLCAYPKETIYVSQEALWQLSNSALGIPVVVDHPSELITDENVSNLAVVGRVSAMEYDSITDTWDAVFVVDNEEAISLLQNGWGVSTAWFGDKYASGGTHNNVGYDRELIEGRYEHLAIVKTPRYEMAVNPIFLNSNTLQQDHNKDIIESSSLKIELPEQSKGHKNMIGKIFKRLVSREELKTNEGEELFVDIDGVDVPLNQVISDVKTLRLNKKNEDEEKEKEEKKEAKKMANDTDEVDIDGEKISVNELKQIYKENKKTNACKKSNGDLKIDVKHKELEEGSKKNSKEDEETQGRFQMVKELHENGITYKLEDQFTSTKERVDMGKARYGKKS